MCLFGGWGMGAEAVCRARNSNLTFVYVVAVVAYICNGGHVKFSSFVSKLPIVFWRKKTATTPL